MRLGGGWGAMVTPTLIGQGAVPRLVIGSVNLAEFFVTTVVTATFGDDYRAGAVAHHHGLGSWRGTVNLIGSGRDKAGEAGHTNAYAQAATPLTSAQVWKASVRAD